jgi:eukaryotic-like serine/threonine-protein kinase
MPSSVPPAPTRFDRYAVGPWLASGGTATVHLGRLVGEAGFSRVVALKRSHPQLAADPQFTAMLIDEARLAARVRHQNVVPVLDVVHAGGELGLVLEYVHGESLGRLLHLSSRRGERPPVSVVATIISGVLHGLHAAHEACDEEGRPLAIVHRDVSPHNVLVGVDGVARVLDFGIAKALGRAQTTREGHVKGKLGYMAPEQLRGEAVDRRADIWSAAVVLWECLTGERLFSSDTEGATIHRVISGNVAPPSRLVPDLSPELDIIVLRGLSLAPEDRFATAREMALAVEAACGVTPSSVVGAWVEDLAADSLAARAKLVAQAERLSLELPAVPAAVEEPTLLTASTTPFTSTRGTRLRAGFAAIAVVASAFVGWEILARPDSSAAPPSHAAAPDAQGAPSAAPTPGAAPASSEASSSVEAPPATTASAKGPEPRPATTVATGHGRRPPAATNRDRCYPAFYVDDKGKHFYPPCPR